MIEQPRGNQDGRGCLMANRSGDLNLLLVCAALLGVFDDDEPGKTPASTEPPPTADPPPGRPRPPKE